MDSRSITLRMAASLGIAAVVQAACALWIVAPSDFGVPLSGIVPAGLTPLMVGSAALFLGLLAAPLSVSEKVESVGLFQTRALFAALWQTVVAAFFLLLAGRVTALDPLRAFQAAAWIGGCVWLTVQLQRALPRQCLGILFLWCVALPLGGYMLAEIFLASPLGSAGWEAAKGAQAETVRAVVRGLLHVSPPTVLGGFLTGTLPDGSPFAFTPPLVGGALVGLVLAWVASRRCVSRIATSQDETSPVETIPATSPATSFQDGDTA